MPRESSQTEGRHDLESCVISFASAVKNLTIYPATHPRVAACVAAFVDSYRRVVRRSCELAFVRDTMLVNKQAVETDHLAVHWLIQRARDTGLRGVAISERCHPDDVVAFAQALISCRPGSKTSLADQWEDDLASVRPLAMLIADSHNPNAKAAETAPTQGDGELLDNLSAGLADKLREVALCPEIQALTNSIDEVRRGDGDDDEQEFQRDTDLVGMIGELLPAEMPNDIESLQATVTRVLESVRAGLMQMMQGGQEIRDADLMDNAIGIARKFFRRESIEIEAPTSLPTGRPGDEKYQASLEDLLEEHKALPRAGGLRLPDAEYFEPDGPLAAMERAGVCLHALQSNEADERSGARLAMLSALVEAHPGELDEMFDAYLAPGVATTSRSLRLTLLRMLTKTAQGTTMVRDRDYLSEDLIRRGFPEILPMVARVFEQPHQFDRMRRALEKLKTILANGGIETARSSGALADPRVVELLARTDSPIAHQLLKRSDVEHDEARAALHAIVSECDLPRAERAALALLPPTSLPGAYLRDLLDMAGRRRVDQLVRRTTGELLRGHLLKVRREGDLSNACETVLALALVPSALTLHTVQQIATHRWWSPLPRTRALRRTARTTLAKLHKKS
ncbi:MAG: hypothetical protein AB8H80_07750 [Planctomycetota bacterium]